MRIAEDDVLAVIMFSGSALIAAASGINLQVTGDRFLSASGFIIAVGISYGIHKVLKQYPLKVKIRNKAEAARDQS